MNNGDVGRAMEVFERALELPARRRSDFIAKELADDPDTWQFCSAMLDSELGKGEAAVVQAVSAMKAPPPEPMPTRFDIYRILGRFPRTEYFDIYLGIAEGATDPVIIKAMRKDRVGLEAAQMMLCDIDARDTLTEEGLLEEHIVPILRVWEWEGRPFFTMPYVRGQYLDQFLESPVSKSWSLRAFFFATLCHALDSVHTGGIVHGDLSHNNVLVDETVQARLIDFGTACIPNRKLPLRRGTGDYVAPERSNPDAVPNPAWDVYSVGLLARELFAYECARDAELDAIVSRAHATDPGERYQEIYPFYCDMADCLLRKGWKKGPRRRLPGDPERELAWAERLFWPKMAVGAVTLVYLIWRLMA